MFDGTTLTHDDPNQTWNDFKLDSEFQVAKSWLLSPVPASPTGRRSTHLTTMDTEGALPAIKIPVPEEGPDPVIVQQATLNCDVSETCQVQGLKLKLHII